MEKTMLRSKRNRRALGAPKTCKFGCCDDFLLSCRGAKQQRRVLRAREKRAARAIINDELGYA